MPVSVEHRVVQIYQTARQARDAGRFEEALQAYRKIEALFSHLKVTATQASSLQYNIGYCLTQLGRVEAALESLAKVQADLLPEPHQRAYLEVLGLLRTTGALLVHCGDDGQATTSLVETELTPRACGTPWLELPPGDYRLVAKRLDGLQTATVVQIEAGKTTKAELDWSPPPGPPDSSTDAIMRWLLPTAAGMTLVGGIALNQVARQSAEEVDQANARVESAQTRHDLDAAERAASDARQAADRAQLQANMSYALLGATAFLTACSLWIWLDDDGANGLNKVTDPKPSARMRVRPTSIAIEW